MMRAKMEGSNIRSLGSILSATMSADSSKTRTD